MTTPRTIRPLSAHDIVALQRLDDAAHGTAWSHRTFLDDVEREDRIHLVVEQDGAPVGHAAAWLDDRSCRITNVAVDADHAGHGHATALMLAVIDQALANPRITNMQLEVRPMNRRAQRMYSRFGFSPVGIERGFYDRSDAQGNRDAVVMAVADVCADSWRQRLNELADHRDGAAA